MAQIDHKLENLNKMIKALERSVKKLEKVEPEDLEFVQDSVVARFKILVEATWKNISLTLELQGFSDLPAAPKGLIGFAVEAKFLTAYEAEAFVKFITLRNLAAHLYDQPQYLLIVQASANALDLIKQIYERMLKQQAVLG